MRVRRMRRSTPPARAATIKDIAAELNVSASTVSRALTRPGMLSPETVERVRKAASKLDYQPNLIARNLKLKSTGVVHVVVPNLHSFFFEVQRGIEKAAREIGYSVVLGHTDRDPEREAEFFDQVLSRSSDGIILVSSVDPAALLGRKKLPPTVLALEGVEGAKLPSVVVDHQAAAEVATAHLIGLGHRRIAHIAGPTLSPMARHRRDGFFKAMRDARLPVSERDSVQGRSTVESGGEAMHELLSRKARPTAIFAANDEMAIGAIRVAKQVGLRVPQDISIVGFNDQGLAEIYDPPVTTIRVPTRELGFDAMMKLRRLLAGEPYEVEDVLPTYLVIRATTAPP